MSHFFNPGERILGPKDLVCESCHKTEFMLHAVEFPDGEIFRVCGMCRDEAHRILSEVFFR